MKARNLIVVFTLGFWWIGCAQSTGNGSGDKEEGIAYTGLFIDSYLQPHRITDTRWEMPLLVFTIIKAGKENRYLIAQNGEGNAYYPGKYSRFDLTVAGSSLYYCQTAYDKETAQDAENTPRAEDSDLEQGCSGFPWTRLDAKEFSLIGTYQDNYSTAHTIDQMQWKMESGYGTSLFHFVKIDEGQKFAIAKNDSQNSYNPNKYSRFDWTYADNTLYYCQTAYDKETAQDAENTPRADDSDPANQGCGGFSWSQLTSQ